jgi:class 3 adenylate cyclase
MVSERRQRRLSAIMVVDVVGFSKLMEADERSTLSMISSLRASLIEPRVAEHSGRIVKFLGDGVLAEFSSAVDAVECAASIQKRLMREATTAGLLRTLRLRIGVNVGDIVVDDEDVLGDGVNIASRLEQLCKPDGILISGTVFDQIQGKTRIKVRDRGLKKVKNISRSIRVYELALPKRIQTKSPPKTVQTIKSEKHIPLRFQLFILSSAIVGAASLSLYYLPSAQAPLEVPPVSPTVAPSVSPTETTWKAFSYVLKFAPRNSYNDAMHYYKELLGRHPRLHDYPMDIEESSSPIAGQDYFSLRIGRFESRVEAVGLCDAIVAESPYNKKDYCVATLIPR